MLRASSPDKLIKTEVPNIYVQYITHQEFFFKKKKEKKVANICLRRFFILMGILFYSLASLNKTHLPHRKSRDEMV